MEGFSENIHDRSLNSIKAADLLDTLNSGLKIFGDEVAYFGEGPAEKYYNPLHGDFLAENIEKDVKALVLVELSKLASDLVVDGEVGGGV